MFDREQEVVPNRKNPASTSTEKIPANALEWLPLWQLEIEEVTGHNLEARGREEVNRLLKSGWKLLHVYTLKYEEDGVWRERPMAILGKPRENAERLLL